MNFGMGNPNLMLLLQFSDSEKIIMAIMSANDVKKYISLIFRYMPTQTASWILKWWSK